jgi:hypothetical protein
MRNAHSNGLRTWIFSRETRKVASAYKVDDKGVPRRESISVFSPGQRPVKVSSRNQYVVKRWSGRTGDCALVVTPDLYRQLSYLPAGERSGPDLPVRLTIFDSTGSESSSISIDAVAIRGKSTKNFPDAAGSDSNYISTIRVSEKLFDLIELHIKTEKVDFYSNKKFEKDVIDMKILEPASGFMYTFVKGSPSRQFNEGMTFFKASIVTSILFVVLQFTLDVLDIANSVRHFFWMVINLLPVLAYPH